MFGKKSTPQRLPEPRAHHYVLAHQFIRIVASRDPLQFFSLMVAEERPRYLEWMWQQVEKHTGQTTGGATAADLRVETCRIKDHPAVILTMPPTRAMIEAHLVAVVLTGSPEEEKPAIRYFTLEDGQHTDGTPRTVLCEWAGETHANFGDGPEATVAAFATAIAQRL